ncbi:hypothetical protein ACFQX4_21080 [Roseomonas sp. GCM10028921]
MTQAGTAAKEDRMTIQGTQQTGTDEPRLFISHKHSDRLIASTLSDFLRQRSAGQVRIFQSSDPKYEGPRIGRNLNQQLREALWQTDALILLYTTEDQDWHYCMYECGLATDRGAPASSIYVLQAGDDWPKVYTDTVRMNARALDDLRRFMRDFFRSPDFFARRQKPLNLRISEADCDQYAKDLHEELLKVLPPVPSTTEIWQAWPFLTIEMATPTIDAAFAAFAAQPARAPLPDAVYHSLLEGSTVSRYNSLIPPLFGRASLPETLPLKDLLADRPAAPGGEAWLRCCLGQVLRGAKRGIVSMNWSPLREPGDDKQYLPALCEVRNMPRRGVMAFDVHFIDVLGPQAMPASNRMLALDRIDWLDIDDPAVRALRLSQLRREMQQGSRLRRPILDAKRRPRFIIHKSLVDDFLVGALDDPSAHGAADHAALTLDHLLRAKESGVLASTTFCTVRPDDSIAEVERRMAAKPKCNDIFVTEDGTRDSPVLGWITNIDLAR